jgi:hypothetical protein
MIFYETNPEWLIFPFSESIVEFSNPNYYKYFVKILWFVLFFPFKVLQFQIGKN